MSNANNDTKALTYDHVSEFVVDELRHVPEEGIVIDEFCDKVADDMEIDDVALLPVLYDIITEVVTDFSNSPDRFKHFTVDFDGDYVYVNEKEAQ